jgi:hypothetical protein
MYLPHEWGPDPDHPGFTACLWCDKPFVDVGGTLCGIDDNARAARNADTIPIPRIEESDPVRRPRLYWVASLLLVLMLTALLVVAAADTVNACTSPASLRS